MISENDINTYLYFGYLPHVNDNVLRYNELYHQLFLSDNDYHNISYNQLIDIGKQKLLNAISSNIENSKSDIYVVPLSGGLDSRAILGGLLKYYDSKLIHTVTYGVPNTFDYEIGKIVAEKACVNNTRINLNNIIVSIEDLIEFTKITGCLIPIFEGIFHSQIMKLYGKDVIYWNGYLGDPLSGSKLNNNNIRIDWNASINVFIKKNKYCSSSNIDSETFIPIKYLPKKPFISKDNITGYEQLDLLLRQPNYIEPIVLLNGYKHRTPFIDKEWAEFILRVPVECRINQKLYKDILKKTFPDLFNLVVKNNMGMPLCASKHRVKLKKVTNQIRTYANDKIPFRTRYTNPSLNYLDFNESLRIRRDIIDIVYACLNDVKERDIVSWVKIDKLWNKHQDRKGDYADILTLIASLEIYLKAGVLSEL
jgi:asparagine synthetase B (glutamine-hydrolysing)